MVTDDGYDVIKNSSESDEQEGSSGRVFAKSPFLYHSGIKYILENAKQDCTFEEISEMRIKGRLTDTDLSILDSLYRYRFLNRYCIEKHLNGDRLSLKKNLAKLVSHGIVLRFYFFWDEQGAITKTPSFYCLSKGTYAFYRKRNPFRTLLDSSIHGFEIPNEISILERLVFNQFHIHFMKRYGDKLIREAYYERVSMKGYEFFIDGYFRLNISGGDNLTKWFDLAVIPIRRSPFWQREFVVKLSLVYSFSKKRPSKLNNPIVLVICEDDLQAKEAFSYKECDGQTRGIFTLYTSDVNMVSYDVLERLYYCEYRHSSELIEEGASGEQESGDGIFIPLDYDGLCYKDLVDSYNPLDNLSRSPGDAKSVYLSVRSLKL